MSNAINNSSSIPLDIRNAVMTSAGVFDLSDRTQIEVTGSDRIRFLHSFTSNDVKRLKPGQGCETFVTNLKGKVVAHVFLFCGEKSHWLDGTPGQQDAIMSHLNKFLLIDDVQLIPRSDERGELFVTGPIAAQLLQVDESMSVGGHEMRDSTGISIDFRRVDLLGQPGFLMSIPRMQLEIVKHGLTSMGVVEGSPDQFEVLRVEAGFPRYGIDISDDNLAQEVARTKACISFDKGCYLGQETIARLDALGHTNRELRRLSFDTDTIFPSGTVIFDSTGTTEAGIITSAARFVGDLTSVPTKSVIALAMVKRAACQPGTVVRVIAAEGNIEGRVLDS